MPQYLNLFVLIPVWLTLAACGAYDITVNEKLVYSPAPLFSDFQVADDALQQCLEQAVIDGGVTSAAGLQALNCSHAGVSDLSGLEIFSGIGRLKLSSNNIRNLTPLAALTSLQLLQLEGNRIVDSTPLLALTALRDLNLAGNSELLCPGPTSLMALENLKLPEHCQ